VQGDRFEIEVVGWRARIRRSPGVLSISDLRRPGKGRDLARAGRVAQARVHDGGRLPSPSARCASTPAATTRKRSTAFANMRLGRHIYAIKGMDGARPIWPRRAGKSGKPQGSNVWMLGVDRPKDLLYSKLKVTTPVPG